MVLNSFPKEATTGPGSEHLIKWSLILIPLLCYWSVHDDNLYTYGYIFEPIFYQHVMLWVCTFVCDQLTLIIPSYLWNIKSIMECIVLLLTHSSPIRWSYLWTRFGQKVNTVLIFYTLSSCPLATNCHSFVTPFLSEYTNYGKGKHQKLLNVTCSAQTHQSHCLNCSFNGQDGYTCISD